MKKVNTLKRLVSIFVTIALLIPVAANSATQSSYPTKAAPVAGDKALITDSADGNKTKQATVGSLPISTATQSALNGKANTSAFASQEAFTAAWGWTPGGGSFDQAGNYTLTGSWDFTGATVTGVSGGSMVYPDAGISVSTGPAWGTSLTLDTDLSSVSASDDSVPSAKATKAAFDLKANASGISFIVGVLSDMKILDSAEPIDGSQWLLDTISYGDASDNLHLWSIEKIGSLLAEKAATTDVYPKSAIDTQEEVETIWGTNITNTIAHGTAAMVTSEIADGACATAVTVSAPGVATTDIINLGFNGTPVGVTGYSPTGTPLNIIAYPTAGEVNFLVCNSTGAAVTPGPLTINWRVDR